MKKSKKVITIILAIIVFLILFFPHRFDYKDGGSKGYEALTYRVTFYNAITDKDDERLKGALVEIFGFKVFDNTHIIRN